MSTLRTIPTRRLLPGQKTVLLALSFFFPVGKWTDNGRGPPPFGGSSVVNHGESEPAAKVRNSGNGHLLTFKKTLRVFFAKETALFTFSRFPHHSMGEDVAFSSLKRICSKITESVFSVAFVGDFQQNDFASW